MLPERASKPVSPAELYRAIGELLKAPVAAGSDPLV